ncbi:thioredoxin family protein [Patescibacteria group bacterium]|nr:thioredoxin family protein [Patescibacteria group bacterium]
MKQVTLTELTSPGCTICKAFEEFWHSIETDWPNVKFRKSDVSTPEGQEMAQKYMILASPGIILNGELWATGGFDREKFVAKLKELSS